MAMPPDTTPCGVHDAPRVPRYDDAPPRRAAEPAVQARDRRDADARLILACGLYGSLHHQWLAAFAADPEYEGDDHLSAAMGGLVEPIIGAEARTLAGHQARAGVVRLIWGAFPPEDETTACRIVRAIVRDLATGWLA